MAKAKADPAQKAAGKALGKAKAKAKAKPVVKDKAGKVDAAPSKAKAQAQSSMVTGLKYQASHAKGELKEDAAQALATYAKLGREDKAKFLEEFKVAKKSGKGLKFFLGYNKDHVHEDLTTDKQIEDFYTRSF